MFPSLYEPHNASKIFKSVIYLPFKYWSTKISFFLIRFSFLLTVNLSTFKACVEVWKVKLIYYQTMLNKK